MHQFRSFDSPLIMDPDGCSLMFTSTYSSAKNRTLSDKSACSTKRYDLEWTSPSGSQLMHVPASHITEASTEEQDTDMKLLTGMAFVRRDWSMP